MAGEEEQLEVCADCGATVYPEHLNKHMAERVAGKLVCAHCLRERTGGGIPLAAEEPAIEYEKKPTAIRPSSAPGVRHEGFALQEERFGRALITGAPNATRCKTFHAKLADAALMHMNTQINQWADSDPLIEIKFATSCIGVVEGKHADPHLIVTVFY